jgi:hypothetical protein
MILRGGRLYFDDTNRFSRLGNLQEVWKLDGLDGINMKSVEDIGI